MSYNPRHSNMLRSNQKPPSSSTKGKQQHQIAEVYILMKDDEIVDCISELGVPIQLDDLKNPTPVQVQLIFEMFADVLMGVRKDTVEPILRAAAQDNLDYPEMQTDAHTMMSFYYSLRQLMAECGVEDFSFSDLTKPEYERLKRILSYLINFTRFREGRTDIIDEVYQKSENDKEKIEQYYYENTEHHNRIQTLRALRVKEEPLIKQAKDLRCELVADLEKLRKKQEALIIDLDNLKQARAVMSKSLEDRQYLKVKTQQESNKIRPYIVDSPEKLQQVICDMADTLVSEKAAQDSLERKSRALQTSADSFGIVNQNVDGCIKVMEEVEQELIKEEEFSRRASRHAEIIAAKQTDVQEIERTEKRLLRQLENAAEKLRRARESGEGKADAAQKRMVELKEAYDVLSRERKERDKEMEKKKIRISRIEKEMADIREGVEEEVAAAHKEFAKMNSHIDLYMSEMEQCI